MESQIACEQFYDYDYSEPITTNFLQNYEKGQLLGNGAFGEVCKYIDTTGKNYKEVAVKAIDPSNKDKYKKNIIREIQFSLQLQHPNILQVFEVDYDHQKNKIQIISEFCDQQDLSSWLEKKRQQILKLKQIENIVNYFLKEFLKAFYYLHKKFKKTSSHNSETVILHRDFKPQNIFLKRTKKDFYPEVKIGDFGLARELLRKLHASTKAGSYHTLAPEILEFWESQNCAQYNQQVDIYSMGCVLHYIITEQYPFSQDMTKDFVISIVLARIKEGQLEQLTNTCLVSQELKDLIRSMLEYNPKERITFDELFKRYHIEELYKQQTEKSSNFTNQFLQIPRLERKIIITGDTPNSQSYIDTWELLDSQDYDKIHPIYTLQTEQFKYNVLLQKQYKNISDYTGILIIHTFLQNQNLQQKIKDLKILKEMYSDLAYIQLIVKDQNTCDEALQQLKSIFEQNQLCYHILDCQNIEEQIQMIIQQIRWQVIENKIQYVDRAKKITALSTPSNSDRKSSQENRQISQSEIPSNPTESSNASNIENNWKK